MCTADCLCGEITSPENIYRIRYCTIPAQAVSPFPQNVKSIQEIVQELSDVIQYLKQSGEPLKSTKPTQFMESGLQGTVFADMFIFDVFVRFKPLFETIPQHVMQQEQEQKNADNKRNILGIHDLQDPRERNKYVIIDDSAITQGARSIDGSVAQLQRNTERAREEQLRLRDKQATVINQRRELLQQQTLLDTQ